nr:uncharacterized protein LOC115260865 [Aedes albopictus]
MIMGLEASGTALTSDAVKAKILQDVKLPSGSKNGGADGALYSNPARRRRGGNGGTPKKDDTCHNCKKRGHFAAKCPQKQTPQRTSGKALCSVFAMGEVSGEEWYFDSGATCHMSRSGNGFVKQQHMAHPVGTANNGNMMSVAKGDDKTDSKNGADDKGGGSRFVTDDETGAASGFGDKTSAGSFTEAFPLSKGKTKVPLR